VLRSVRELEKFRVTDVRGQPCGRIKDLYFDDQSWEIQHLVMALDPRYFGQRQILVPPATIDAFYEAEEVLALKGLSTELEQAPSLASVLPVCKQYASLALASPGASTLARGLVTANPHLRSARTVINYRISVAGEFAGTLSDFLFDPKEATIRYLAVQQIIDRRKLQFHILPVAVERFTWATQRVILKHLQPVALEDSTEFSADPLLNTAA
jgi:sporulation protein YlmC with PRC-barrel domain